MAFLIDYTHELGEPFYAEFEFGRQGTDENVRLDPATQHRFIIHDDDRCSDWWNGSGIVATEVNGLITVVDNVLVISIPADRFYRWPCCARQSARYSLSAIPLPPRQPQLIARGTISFGDS